MKYYSLSIKKRGLFLPLVLSLIFWAVVFFAIFGCSGCSKYDPSLYPSYDVLNPGEDVRRNPLGFNADGNLIVTPSFIAWVDELKQEVIKLRKAIK